MMKFDLIEKSKSGIVRAADFLSAVGGIYFGAIAVAVVLLVIPLSSVPHEFCHALTARALGRNVEFIVVPVPLPKAGVEALGFHWYFRPLKLNHSGGKMAGGNPFTRIDFKDATAAEVILISGAGPASDFSLAVALIVSLWVFRLKLGPKAKFTLGCAAIALLITAIVNLAPSGGGSPEEPNDGMRIYRAFKTMLS